MNSLEQHVLEILSAHPGGIDEHALIKALQCADHKGVTGASLTQPLELFRVHFLLFHALYRLRERLWQEERGHLEIGMSRIVLRPYRRGVAGLAGRDPLRDYYLDLDNLKTTTEEDVIELLAGFWTRLQANERRAEALAVLGLRDPVDHAAVKKQYRVLAMQHHPDRGGDTARLQAINHAMAILEACHRKP